MTAYLRVRSRSSDGPSQLLLSAPRRRRDDLRRIGDDIYVGTPSARLPAGRRPPVEVPLQRVPADRVGRGVGAVLVQEFQRRIGRRHEGIALERGGGAREVEAAVEVSARDVGLDA